MIQEDGSGEKTQRRPDVCWTIIVTVLVRSSHILYCLLSCSEQALKGFQICFHRRESKGTEVKHRPQAHDPCAYCPTHTNHWLSYKTQPLAPCKRQRSNINFQCPLCHTGSSQAWLCPAAAMPGPGLTSSALQGLRCLRHRATQQAPLTASPCCGGDHHPGALVCLFRMHSWFFPCCYWVRCP